MTRHPVHRDARPSPVCPLCEHDAPGCHLLAWSRSIVSESCHTCVCILVFYNPQHAARRAMAAACRCPRGQQRFFQRKSISSPTHWESNRGTRYSFSPTKPPRLTKEQRIKVKGKDNGNERQYRRPCTIIEPQPTPRPRTACREGEPLGRLRAALLPLAALACIFRLPPRCTCRCPAPNTGVSTPALRCCTTGTCLTRGGGGPSFFREKRI